jgi:hypothetical protein
MDFLRVKVLAPDGVEVFCGQICITHPLRPFKLCPRLFHKWRATPIEHGTRPYLIAT